MTITANQLIEFVYDEARLLDETRYEAWLSLFAEDGHYWMPLTPGQTDHTLHTSLMYEDMFLLRVRVERLKNNRTFSQQPASRGHHLLQQPQVMPFTDADQEFEVRTAFHYVETRLDTQQLYVGWFTHTLIESHGALRIRLKKVALVNCDAAFGSIQLFI